MKARVKDTENMREVRSLREKIGTIVEVERGDFEIYHDINRWCYTIDDLEFIDEKDLSKVGTQERKIVQIACCGVSNTYNTIYNSCLYALCDDGSVWELRDNASIWGRLPNIFEGI
jgi:hypothetical protein